MKFYILFLIIFLFNKAFSQEKPPSPNPFIIQKIYIDSSDKFEWSYSQYSNSYYCDTLPWYGNAEESKAWLNFQTICHFPDTLNVKVIIFKDGKRSTYYFFFNGPNLIKVRFKDIKDYRKSRFYRYTIEENQKLKENKKTEILKGIIHQDKKTLLSIALELKKT